MTAINKSKNVVIIGYSFPLYNRFYDKHLFTNDNIENTNIYIQDINPQELCETFKSSFGITNYKGSAKVIPISNCNSFFVPNEILP